MEINKTLASNLPKKIINNTTVVKNTKIYEETSDIFVRSDAVKNVAKEFRSRIIVPFSDWKGVLPVDGDEGADLLKKSMALFTGFVDKLSKVDAERFTKLAIGENHLEVIKNSSIVNKDVKLFKDTLEKSLGKTIENVIKPN